LPRRVSGLSWTDSAQRPRRPQAGLGEMGHADAADAHQRQARSRHHQHSQLELAALAALAWHRKPLLAPFPSFSENEELPDGRRPPVWFAFDESRPLASFAGISSA